MSKCANPDLSRSAASAGVASTSTGWEQRASGFCDGGARTIGSQASQGYGNTDDHDRLVRLLGNDPFRAARIGDANPFSSWLQAGTTMGGSSTTPSGGLPNTSDGSGGPGDSEEPSDTSGPELLAVSDTGNSTPTFSLVRLTRKGTSLLWPTGRRTRGHWLITPIRPQAPGFLLIQGGSALSIRRDSGICLKIADNGQDWLPGTAFQLPFAPAAATTLAFKGSGARQLAFWRDEDSTVELMENPASGTPVSISRTSVSVVSDGIATLDMNRDGYDDLALVQFGTGKVSYLLNNRKGGLSLVSRNATLPSAPVRISVRNEKGNVILTLLAVRLDHQLLLALDKPSGPEALATIGAIPSGNALLVGDLNGDSIPELGLAHLTPEE